MSPNQPLNSRLRISILPENGDEPNLPDGSGIVVTCTEALPMPEGLVAVHVNVYVAPGTSVKGEIRNACSCNRSTW
jgi:hypothetical protein